MPTITPLSGDLAFSPTAPILNRVNPPAANLVLSGTAPILNIFANPPAADLAFSPTAPILNRFDPPAADLAFSSTEPGLNKFAYPPAGNLVFSRTAPDLNKLANPPTANLVLSGTAPDVNVGFRPPAPIGPVDRRRDRHVRRTGSDYTQAFFSLLPKGQAWPRETDSVLARTVDGLSQYWGFVDSRAADLLEQETDPRHTVELLPDWEKAWGLPDPCFPSATTIAERQLMLVLFMTRMGGQSRQYFIDLAKWATGYTIEIEEFAPFVCGISQVGDTRTFVDFQEDKLFRWYIGPPEQRFYWTVNVGEVGLTWFRASSGEAGVDTHVKFSIPEELICLLQRWKPAHTHIVPDFSAIAAGGSMQGTP
jgi:uncharacterized protein YmfQ (DUF2313 family)